MRTFFRLIWLSSICMLIVSSASAQSTRHIVWLKNKGGNSFSLSNPSAYLSARAIQRRTSQQLSIDSTDLPVTASYLNSLRSVNGVTILNVSKWLNAVCIQTSNASALTTVQQLPFVQATAGLAARTGAGKENDKFIETQRIIPLAETTAKPGELSGDFYNYGGSAGAEIKLHKGEFLHNIGLRGQGMQIALLDGGFFNYTTLRAFDSVNRNGQILSTWDFVSGNASVSEDHPHGMQCLSTIAANIPGQFGGKTPRWAILILIIRYSITPTINLTVTQPFRYGEPIWPLKKDYWFLIPLAMKATLHGAISSPLRMETVCCP